MQTYIFDTFLDCAAECWAAAAGAAGAYAPRHIADALMADNHRGDLVAAIAAGTGRAYQQWLDEGAHGPKPRGCSVRYDSGLPHSIVWGSDSHTISIWRSGPEDWTVELICDTEVSYRYTAMRKAYEKQNQCAAREVAIAAWESETGQRRAALDEPADLFTLEGGTSVWLPRNLEPPH